MKGRDSKIEIQRPRRHNECKRKRNCGENRECTTNRLGGGHSPAELADITNRPRMHMNKIFDGPKSSQPGPSGFKIVLMKHMGKDWQELYRDMMVLIQSTSVMPDDFLHTLIAGIPKSDGGLRLIQLLEEPMKQLDDILFSPIEGKMYKNETISKSNVAYTPGNSASEAVDWLNLVLADANRRGKKIAILLYDYKKFFDVARWDMVEAVMRAYGVPEERFMHMNQFYDKCSHELLTCYGKTESFERRSGTIVQGGKKSPIHAKILLELLTRHMDASPGGYEMEDGSRQVHVDYCDDATHVIEGTVEHIKERLKRLSEVLELVGMGIKKEATAIFTNFEIKEEMTLRCWEPWKGEEVILKIPVHNADKKWKILGITRSINVAFGGCEKDQTSQIAFLHKRLRTLKLKAAEHAYAARTFISSTLNYAAVAKGYGSETLHRLDSYNHKACRLSGGLNKATPRYQLMTTRRNGGLGRHASRRITWDWWQWS